MPRNTQALSQKTRDHKIRRLKKHLNWTNKDGVKVHANDPCALDALKRLESVK
jgi:hypothetical protein